MIVVKLWPRIDILSFKIYTKKMSKRKVYLSLFGILILAFFCGNLVSPVYFNRGVDSLNKKLNWNFPYFPSVPFQLGLDLQGGTHLVYEADLSKTKKENYESSMAGLRDVIERRVNFFGVSEPIVQTQQAGDNYRLIVELAGVMDPAQAIKEIGKTPFLEFREPKADYLEIVEKNREIFEGAEGEFEEPFQGTELTGKYLEKAEISFHQTTYQPLVLLQFNEGGSLIFEELTGKYAGKPLAIYIDGFLVSSPVVQEKISGGKAQITGDFTIDEAKALARNLNAGALPLPIDLISQQTVGPTLGEISLQKSLKAGLAGIIAVILFLMLFYRLPGLLASLALGIYVVITLSLFKLIPVTLTLAGIGGFILSIGMAIDANILIFSRMREELSGGKLFPIALEDGFKRAWPSIRDGNFTTLLVAFILFSFGTGFVKGFALTLGIGILVSLFSAIVITKTFLRCFEGGRMEKIKYLWRR